MPNQHSDHQPRWVDLARYDERLDGPSHADVLDDHGFLKEPDLWSRDLSLGLAAEIGLGELTETHWRLIDQVRTDYLDTGMLPVQPTLCHERAGS